MSKNNDLISRSALLAAYDAAHKGPPGGARKLMQEAPAIDAAPVVHAKSIHVSPFKPGAKIVVWRADELCSNCMAYVSTDWNYCQRCGAKLDGR